MKNKLMPLLDKLLLRKRSIIETINDQLKNISQIEHTRHRSSTNFLVNCVTGITFRVAEVGRFIDLPKSMIFLATSDSQVIEVNIGCFPLLGGMQHTNFR